MDHEQGERVEIERLNAALGAAHASAAAHREMMAKDFDRLEAERDAAIARAEQAEASLAEERQRSESARRRSGDPAAWEALSSGDRSDFLQFLHDESEDVEDEDEEFKASWIRKCAAASAALGRGDAPSRFTDPHEAEARPPLDMPDAGGDEADRWAEQLKRRRSFGGAR